LRLATTSSARFGGRQPYSIVRKILYVISVIDKVLGINNQQKKTGIVGSDYSKALLRYQRYIFVALLALIAVTLFLR
jgi:non-canonical (house-cleaning) NTP pyrophosphatase